ncbi:MAG: radical SAM protein [Akkermansia sp.]|nr:radical SAM protein [Akkermansia sp.]
MMMRVLTCTLCLTHDCTLRCRYCYAGRKYSHAMSRETARKAIDICMGEARRLGWGADISFFGGEPLLEWELLQWCCDYVTEHAAGMVVPPRFGITTNGTLLTPERLEWMAERDFLIGLSLDGSPAMHDINRCRADGSGSHDDVARALELFEQHPTIRSKVICVVSPNNVHLLSQGVQWLAAHYSGEIGLNLDFWSEWTDEQFEVLSAQCRLVAEQVLQSYREGKPVKLCNFESKILAHVQSNDCEESCMKCRIGEREIAVSVDGNFFPCSRLIGEGDNPELNFGNVNEGIHRARQHRIIAERGNATPACKLCALRSRCMNSCGCTNYASSGHINQVSPFLCCSEKLFISLADELAETLYAEGNPAFLRRFYPGCQE